MRIGMMVDLYKPYISGVTIYVEVNRRYLESLGHEVFVFTFGKDKDYQDDEPRVYRTPGLPIAEGFSFNVKHSRNVKKVLQTMDVIHVHHPFISGRLALRYGRPLNIPIVFTNHTRYDIYAQNYAHFVPKGVSTSFLESYMPRFCSQVDMVVSPSAGMAAVLQDMKVTAPVTVVPNGVDTARFKQANGRPLRKKFGFSENDVVFVYTGRLASEKNIPMVINAFNGVAQTVENAHLLLVGSGPSEKELQAQAAASPVTERIHFTGRIPYEEMPDHLNMCDVYVTASASEVHPLTVIEAMSAGLPVIGIHSPGVGDTVETKITGFLCQDGDLAAFTANMTHLAIDETLRMAMSKTARQMADVYAIERTGATMLDHYSRLAAQNEPRRRGLTYRFKQLWESFVT